MAEKPTVSIAIETSCRVGGAALGLGDELVRTITFDAAARHATQLVWQLRPLLADAGLKPADADELYVSAGPGSFTGLRVGITAARTLAQAIRNIRCVAVPTTLAIAQNAARRHWENLGVILDAGQGEIYAELFARETTSPRPSADGPLPDQPMPDAQEALEPSSGITPAGPGRIVSPKQFLAEAPRPLLLIGEGLARHELTSAGVTLGDVGELELHLPNAKNVWRVGHGLAAAGQFTPRPELLPIYLRQPQAVRLRPGP